MPAAPAPQPPSPALQQALGAALQADVCRALAGLQAADAQPLPADAAALRADLEDRFATDRPAPLHGLGDDWLDALAAAYLRCWHRALRDPREREAAEAELRRQAAAGVGLPVDTDDEALDAALQAAVAARGWNALLGRTLPLRELMLWRHQTVEPCRVQLPEGETTLPVHRLDGFALLGWADHATAGRRGTGGWATPDGLFAVVPRYADLDSEVFRVSFLAHEAQHALDLARFGDLPPWRLEQRAKLAELALARDTLPRLLRTFASQQSDDPALPHPHAHRRLMQALLDELGADPATVPAGAVSAAAAALLGRDTQRLQVGGG